ncbi:MAG: hypothetical protein HOI02_01095, partial [Rhodospirillaceae bacterium]|nr:hypothetical protein [Rhodospirillaceae bacterium]
GHESKVEPAKRQAEIEQDVAEAPVGEVPVGALPLLLPPPPVPAVKQVTLAPEPVPEAPTELSESLSQAPPETVAPAQAEISPKEILLPVVAVKVSELAPMVNEQTEALAANIEPAPEAAPMPKPRPISKSTKAHEPKTEALLKSKKAQRDPVPRHDKVARSEVDFVAPDPVVEAEGRVLLRILEHGSGPEIEIAWPVSAIKRRALYRLFEACYGMEIALLDSAGRLYSRAGQAGRPWQPNLDRYSGFVRQPSGRLTSDEKDNVSRIRALHGGLRAASNVRLFPRRLDAFLLGGLKALIGEGYSRASAIRAHYRRDGDSVLVEGIRLDGRPISGRVDLSKAGQRCRGGAWS